TIRSKNPPKWGFHGMGLLSESARPITVQVGTTTFDLKAMGPEEVALSLCEVGRALRLPIAIEIAQRRRKADHREFSDGGGRDHLPQARVAIFHDGDKVWHHEKIGCLALGIG